MADGGASRSAWEIIESHREKVKAEVTDGDIHTDDDAYRNPNNLPAEYTDLVDGWSSLLSPIESRLLPTCLTSNAAESHELTLSDDLKAQVVMDEGCRRPNCLPLADSNDAEGDDLSVLQLCPTLKRKAGIPSSYHQSSNADEHLTLEPLEDYVDSPVKDDNIFPSLLRNDRAVVDAVEFKAHTATDDGTGSLHLYCQNELLDAANLIDEINSQLENSSVDDITVGGLPDIVASTKSLLSAQSDSQEEQEACSASPFEVTAVTVDDNSLAAVGDILASVNTQMFDSVINDLDYLNANITQCIIEKTLLEETISVREEEFTSGGACGLAAGNSSPNAVGDFPVNSNNQAFNYDINNSDYFRASIAQWGGTGNIIDGVLLNGGDELPTAPYGDGERFVLYGTADTHQEELSLDLEAQITEFINNSSRIVRNKIEKWADELAWGLECESIDSEEEQTTLQLTDVPDEILLKILSYIPLQTNLSVISLVCKRWYILAADPSLWQHIYIGADTTIDPHWLCYAVSRSPQLKVLSIRGDHNIRRESMSLLTLYCPMLTSVDFGFCQITLPMLNLLVNRCPNITKTNFEGCEAIVAGWIETLCLLKKLDSVNISHCLTVEDHDVIYLSEHLSNIVNINIDGNSLLSDSSVISLCSKHFDSLVTLNIDGAESTDKSIAAVSACTNLNVLTVSFAENITATSIPYLQRLQWLLHLQIRKNQLLQTSSLRSLFLSDSLQYLFHLDLTECIYVTDVVVEALCKCCTRLVRLILCWCWDITDRGVECIVNSCDNMEYLDLSGLELIKGDSFGLLPTKLPKLTFLNLVQSNRIDDKLIRDVLDRMPQLTAINYYHEDFRTAI